MLAKVSGRTLELRRVAGVAAASRLIIATSTAEVATSVAIFWIGWRVRRERKRMSRVFVPLVMRTTVTDSDKAPPYHYPTRGQLIRSPFSSGN